MNRNVSYYERAAQDSANDSQLWFRYLRKIITPKGRTISEDDINALLNSDKLTEYQKSALKQADTEGSVINKYVIGLNQRAKTPMMDLIYRKYGKR